MDGINVGSIIVAIIAALAAYAAQRSAAKAASRNTDSSLEAKRLEQAYERARKFDVDTIARQDAEIEELRQEVAVIKTENQTIKSENKDLKDRVAHLEWELHNRQ